MESFLKDHLNDEHCFLCGTELTDATRSDEHVIPDWLQKEHNLRDERLTLLNHSSIPYRQAVIPCCKECNNGPLATMEREVSDLLKGPYRKPTAAEELRLFQWCSKILYGILHREMMLRADQRDKLSGSIVQREFLERLTTFHHFMTSVRRPMRFVDFVPYSLFVVETLTYEQADRNFDYFDFVAVGEEGAFRVTLVLAIRVQHFGIICALQDNGYQKQEYQKQFDRFDGVSMHPIQFMEFACKTAYKHSLLSFSPRYTSVAGSALGSEVVVTRETYPNGKIWETWNPSNYAKLFYGVACRAGFVVPEPEELCVGDKHLTWLFDDDGTPKRITAQDEEFVPRRSDTRDA